MSREMSANERALREIMENLKFGIHFGKIRPHRLGGYYFDTALWYAHSESIADFGKPYIYWRNYGQSANKPTLQNLRWILREIFKTSPSEFLMTYTTYDHYKAVTGQKY